MTESLHSIVSQGKINDPIRSFLDPTVVYDLPDVLRYTFTFRA
jgi:hypothetical protein